MSSQSLRGAEANKFITEHLVEVSSDPVRWQTTYEDPRSGQLWVLDYPDSSYHGGGSPLLRSLPLDRADIIEILLERLHLNVAERQQLIPCYVRESELAELIESKFRRYGFYPPYQRPWPVDGVVYEGHVLQRIGEETISLWNQRDTPLASGTVLEQGETRFTSVSEAVYAYIRREWPGRQIDGIRIYSGLEATADPSE